jgi:hypothetical protein
MALCKHKVKKVLKIEEEFICGCEDYSCDAPGNDIMDCPNLIIKQHKTCECEFCGEEFKSSR